MLQEAAQAVSVWMVEAIRPQPGQRVLELAAGPGDTGFLAAELIRPGGTLITSDGSEVMVEVARARARELGLDNVEFRVLDAEWIDLPTADVDAVLCRWAYMLLADPEAALRETRRVLRPGGRLALAAWTGPECNPWTALVREEAIEQGLAAPEAPGEPSMFAFAPPGLLEELLEGAGFTEIERSTVDFVRPHASVDEWLAVTRDVSPHLGALLRELAPRSLDAFRDGLVRRAAPFTAADGSVSLPAQALVAAATA